MFTVGVQVPCHVYLTLAADLQTSVFVNYHTTTAQPTQVRLARVSKSNVDGGGGGGGEVPAVVLVTGTSSVWAIETERWIHTVLLSNLSPDSTYVKSSTVCHDYTLHLSRAALGA